MSILRSMVALWFGGLSGCAGAQIELVDVRSRHADETTFAVACAKFEAIVAALGSPLPRIDGRRCRIMRSDLQRHYELQTKSGDWLCTVDARYGDVTSLTNMKRRTDQYKRIGRTGAQRFHTESEVKNYMRALATKCGVPATAAFSSLEWKQDGEVADGNSSGTIWANYRIPGREAFQVSVDPQDGMLVAYRHETKR